MLRLEHPNVVRCVELPDELKCQLTEGDMPVLAMEYCELGDLRRVTRTQTVNYAALSCSYFCVDVLCCSVQYYTAVFFMQVRVSDF